MSDFTNEVGPEGNKAVVAESLVMTNFAMLAKEIEEGRQLVNMIMKRLRIVLPERAKDVTSATPPSQGELCELAKKLAEVRFVAEAMTGDLRYIRDNVQV